MVRKNLITLVLVCGVSLSGCTVFKDIVPSEKLTPTELRCEYAKNPLGVDVAGPRLFWKLESDVRSQRQSAFQILVASSLKNLAQDKGDLWNSGKVESDQTIHISYKGLPLKSSQQVFWKVRLWDKDGKVSSWSRPATWTMGILSEADWKARWIGAEAESNYPGDDDPGNKALDKPPAFPGPFFYLVQRRVKSTVRYAAP